MEMGRRVRDTRLIAMACIAARQGALALRTERSFRKQRSKRVQTLAAGQGSQQDLGQNDPGSLKECPETKLEGRVEVPGRPGVYAVFDPEEQLQFVGISRKLSASIAAHIQDLPDHCGSIKFKELPDADRDTLTSAWKKWIEEYVSETNEVPPGNMPGETKWTQPKGGSKRSKPDIKLTPGKGEEDLTVPITDLVDKVVKEKNVVAFTKGTRDQPQCGFSHKVMQALNETGVDYDVVNVLDETYNPGLREAIKEYSDWPTIPQLYVEGEFIGGCDIVLEMFNSGELHDILGANRTSSSQSA